MNESLPLWLVDWAFKGSVVLACCWLASRAFPGKPSIRRAFGVASFCAALLLPALAFLTPGLIEVRVPSALPQAASTVSTASAPSIWLILWVIGLVAVMSNVAAGWIAIRRLGWRSEMCKTFAPELIDELRRSSGVHRPCDLRISLTSNPPAALTWGWRRPVVLLPRDADEWDEEQLRPVLLHEFAHVRRMDSLAQVVTCLVCAVFWFNPLSWLCAAALRADSEAAADESVIEKGVKPSHYAGVLLAIAARLSGARQPGNSFGVSIVKQTQIESRIRAIVRTRARRGAATPLHTLIASGLVLMLTIVLAVARPTPDVTAQYPGKSKEWYEGYEFGKRNASTLPPVSYDDPPGAAEKREIELRAIEMMKRR